MSNYINNSGQIRLGWRVPTGDQLQTATYLFDNYSGTSAAYSLRKLSATYSGSAIRVRRSSDNVEQNIGFDTSGNLDTTSLLNFVNQQDTSKLLDQYSGAAVAYSLRKLSATYSGSAIRVRRSSDNTEQNIGFDAVGNLDTTSLLSFVGTGNGFVTTWYDQSGNVRNASQSSAANQPKIVNSGSVILENGRPTVSFTTSHTLSTATQNLSFYDCAISYVSKNISRTAYACGIFGYGTNNQGSRVRYLGVVNNTLSFIYFGADFWSNFTGMGDTKLTLYSLNFQSNSVNFYKNTSTQTGSQFSLLNTTSSSFAINDIYGRGEMANINFSEGIFYTTGQSTNMNGIRSNQNSYYSTDAYVTKWYDQSGSGRDAIQVTSSFQPQIVSECSLILRSGKPAIYFDGVDDTLRLSTVLPISDITTLFTVAFANYENSSNDIVFGRRGAASYRFGGGNSLINSLCITRAESSDYIYASTPASTTGLNTLAVFHNHYAFGNYDGLNRTRIYSNGVWRNDGNSFGQSSFNNIEYIGSGGDCQFFKNTIQELVHYPSNQINNRISIENNINSYYSIWNRTPVVSDGLHFNFDFSDINSYLRSGTELFNIGGTNSIVKGSLVGSPVFATANSGVLNLNGSNQYISIPGLSSVLNNKTNFTYETWFKVNSTTTFGTLFSFGNNDNYSNDIMFFISGNQIYLQVNNGVDNSAVVTFTSTAWNSMSVVYDGTKTGNSNRLKLYINGVQQTLNFGTYNVPSSTSNVGLVNSGIGAYSTGNWNNLLSGSIGSSRLYTKSLTDEEVLQNFNASKSRFGL